MIRKSFSLFFFGWVLIFLFAYYDRYFQWRDCFNELGRCFDPETGVVYVEQAGIVWLTFTIISAITAFILWPKR